MTGPHLDPAPLDPLVRRLFVGVAFSALGNGLTLPFLYVYLAEVRDIPTTTTGLLFAWMGLVGVAVSPVVGILVDRAGPRAVIFGALLVEATGVACLTLVESASGAFVVLGVVSLGGSAMWPASTSLLARLVPETARERVFGLQFMLLNAGIGAGGLVSALIVDVEDPGSFQLIYAVDALTYLVFVGVVASLPGATGRAVAAGPTSEEDRRAGWSTVLRDRTAMRVSLISVLVVTFGYAQLEAGFSAYTVDVVGMSPNVLGLAFAANTLVIVLGQLLSLRLIQGRRRSRMLAICAGTWSAAWAVVAAAALVDLHLAAVLAVLGLGLFGLGETLWAPLAPALVNDLAPEHLRGRYNALSGGTWTVSMILGPAVAGMLIGHDLAVVWVVVTVGGPALGAWLFLGLRHHLTDSQDGVGDLAGSTEVRGA
jgi:MFS family permease